MKKWTDRMETPIQAELICYDVNGIHIVFGVTKEKALKLFHFSSAPFDAENLCRKPDNWWPMEGMREAQIEESFQLVQVNFSGYNRPYEKHGNKYIVTAPGFMLKFDSILEERNEDGDLLRIVQKDDVTGARVESVMQFYDGLPVARMYNTVTNEGSENQTLEYISSFSYWGIEKEQKEGIPEFISSDDKMSMIVVHNGWQKELTVKKYRFADLGMAQTQPHNYQRTSKTIEITNTGNWSAKEYVPMGYIGNSVADASLFFEIDHSGSWHYEIGDQNCHFYLAVSGPTEIQSHWSKNLKPGDSFTTVPVAVGVGHDDFEEAIGTLTKYRRRIRRPNKDNENLPVIFNDYMNCLFGDPTTEKEFPLVVIIQIIQCIRLSMKCELSIIDTVKWIFQFFCFVFCRRIYPHCPSEVPCHIRDLFLPPVCICAVIVRKFKIPKYVNILCIFRPISHLRRQHIIIHGRITIFICQKITFIRHDRQIDICVCIRKVTIIDFPKTRDGILQ